jgi:endogenous inhibitor of DNA gyrase (YacG/DUF329 family)
MTSIDKESIRRMRAEELGYKAIASKLLLSVDSVKSFCRRERLDSVTTKTTDDTCRQCGKPLERKPGAVQKKFCSDRCRSAWWSGHACLYKHKEENKKVCAHCGRAFYSFQSKQRKYCGHACYVSYRFLGRYAP